MIFRVAPLVELISRVPSVFFLAVMPAPLALMASTAWSKSVRVFRSMVESTVPLLLPDTSIFRSKRPTAAVLVITASVRAEALTGEPAELTFLTISEAVSVAPIAPTLYCLPLAETFRSVIAAVAAAELAVPKPLPAVPALSEMKAPMLLALALPSDTSMVSLALAPTWKAVEPKEPSSSLRPPKVVVSAIRVSSFCNAPTSFCRAVRSVASLEPLAACRARSRIRCRMLVDCCRAPSAVCAREMPSLALRVATLRPLIWLVRRLEICRPAASSLALLMREPVDRRSSEVLSALDVLVILRWVLRDAMLVLTVKAMVMSSED
ncbi:hypothetical protein D9M69_217060 [compost metagenome]